MSTPIRIVAQYTMDEYYQNFKSATDFFTLQDFIFNCGAVLGDLYQQYYKAKYEEFRSEKQEEVVGFSHDWLATLDVNVKREKDEIFAEIPGGIMSFPDDMQDIGIQEIFALMPAGAEFERANMSQVWQFKLLPNTNRIFYLVERVKNVRVKFFNKGDCNIGLIRIFYVPAISDTMEVPDGVVKYVITNTAAFMKALAKDTVVKESLDGNSNETLATEIDKAQLK